MPEYVEKYGVRWPTGDPLQIEFACIRRGGKWKDKAGNECGAGLFHHYKAAMTALWPFFEWHKWSELLLKCFVENSEVGVNGPASSGKTFLASAWGLCTYYVWPKGTSIIMSSTSRDGLQRRVWGTVKELHQKAKERRPELPGHLIESRFMLATDGVDEEVRDFRDGLIGVACRVGGTFVGLANYVGLKNERIILIADEASLMERGFYDSVANLRKNPFFKLVALGNPKDKTDCLGLISEPSVESGGWEGLDYAETTRTWKTRARGGIAVQLCGYDSPNFSYPAGVNPYRGLITPEHIEADLAYYGRDSLQFTMMNLGCYPRDGGNRRVITRTLCEKNGALEDVIWADGPLTTVAGLDAAYSGVGGDRCVLTVLKYGKDIHGFLRLAYAVPPILVPTGQRKVDKEGRPLTVEEQIADFIIQKSSEFGFTPERFGLDSTGRGSLVSALAQRWSPNVIAVEFGGRPFERPMAMEGDKRNEREAYGKMVSALWFASRAVIESGHLRKLPSEVMEEGCIREWGTNKDGKTDVETKDKTKLRMGRSPDLWDSLVVAIEVARRTGFQIARSSNAILKSGPPLRLLKLRDDRNRLLRSQQLDYAA